VERLRRLRPALGRLSASDFASGIGKWRTTKTLAGPACGRAQDRGGDPAETEIAPALFVHACQRAQVRAFAMRAPRHVVRPGPREVHRSKPVPMEQPPLKSASQRKTTFIASTEPTQPETACGLPVAEEHVRVAAYGAFQARMRAGVPGDSVSDWLEAEHRLSQRQSIAGPFRYRQLISGRAGGGRRPGRSAAQR
jgi:hypothetical protein